MTTEPALVSSPPVTYAQGYQYPILQNGGSRHIDHSNFWGYGNAIQLGTSNRAAPFVVTSRRSATYRDPNDGSAA